MADNRTPLSGIGNGMMKLIDQMDISKHIKMLDINSIVSMAPVRQMPVNHQRSKVSDAPIDMAVKPIKRTT